MEAAVGLVGEGHFDEASFERWNQIEPPEIISPRESENFLQRRAGRGLAAGH